MSFHVTPFTFNFVDSIIDIDEGITDIDCAILYTAIKQAQASIEGIIYEQIGRGSGLNELGPGVQVGLTIELLGTWQLRFPSGNYTARIAGGNLIGGPSGDPIAYTAGVQTLLIQSAASTVVNSGGSIPTTSQIATAVWAKEIEASHSAENILRIISAVLAGKVSGAGSGTESFIGIDGTTVRVISNNDNNGNRTNLTLDGS